MDELLPLQYKMFIVSTFYIATDTNQAEHGSVVKIETINNSVIATFIVTVIFICSISLLYVT